MRNRIIGIIIVACTLLILFAGTATGFGSFLVNKSPQLLNIMTTAPNGARYTVGSIIGEIATDLVPILWVPEVVHGAFTGGISFGNSTFSKIPRIINVIAGGTDPDVITITFDLSALSFLDESDVPSLPPDMRRHLEVYIDAQHAPLLLDPGGIYPITCAKGSVLYFAFSQWNSSYVPFYELSTDDHSVPVRVDRGNPIQDILGKKAYWTRLNDPYDYQYLIFSVVEPSE